MNNTTSKHNNLFPNPVFTRPYPSTYQNYSGKRCSGRDCTKSAKNLLDVLFINKRGFFCDECACDLLANKLVVSVHESDLS
ncbi:MAG: hypothetical protein ACRD47_08500 [Nitrososphaeraceae archaeon]